MRSVGLGIATIAMMAAVAGCGGGAKTSDKNTTESATPPVSTTDSATKMETVDIPFKIGIMTGTVSQGEDEFRAGQQLAQKYGARVKHVTYPDNFMNEQETVIAQMVGLAADPTRMPACSSR